MNMNLDYSFLFNNNSGMGGQSSGMFDLGNYYSIKNGSYLKLTKAYYAKMEKEEASDKKDGNSSNSVDSTKALTSIQKDSDEAKESADALLKKGANSLFAKKNITTKNEDGTETTSFDYDKNAIYKGVSEFVKDYNALIDSSGKSNNNSILRQTLSITNAAKAYSRTLADIGITIGSDNKLTIDEKAFKASSMSTAKSVFNDSGSFGYQVSSKASQINFYADKDAEKANTYNKKGGFSDPFTNGNLYNQFF